MGFEDSVISTLRQLSVLQIKILEYYIIQKCFSVKCLLLANDIKSMTKYGRQGLPIDSNCQHSDTSGSGALDGTGSIALGAGRSRDSRNVWVSPVGSAVIILFTKPESHTPIGVGHHEFGIDSLDSARGWCYVCNIACVCLGPTCS